MFSKEMKLAYYEAMIWTDELLWRELDDIPMGTVGFDSISPELEEYTVQVIEKFIALVDAAGIPWYNMDSPNQFGIAEMFGHDLWLTSNSHGSGFWDGDYGGYEDALSDIARTFYTEVELGDDGMIYPCGDIENIVQ